MTLVLRALGGRFAVCRLAPDAGWPAWADASRELLSMTRTDRETSVVCEERLVPSAELAERGFSAFELEGPIPFSATGVLATLLVPLREAAVSVVPLGTYDTDYLLVKASDESRAVSAWGAAGPPGHPPAR